VVGGAKGAAGDDRLARRDAAGGAVDPGDFERLLEVEQRQNAAQALSEHRLARPGGTAQQQRVAAAGADFERALRALLAAHVSEVGAGVHLCRRRAQVGAGDGQGLAPEQVVEHLSEVARGAHLDPGREAGFRTVARRHDDAPAARLAGGEGQRQGAPDRSQTTVQGQLAHEGQTLQCRGLEAAGGGQDSDGDGQVETGAALAQPGGGEVDGDAAVRERPADAGDGGANAGGALANGRLGQADDVDARQLRADPDLHLDGDPVDPVQGGAPNARH
jgi:hypothetical protein